MHIEIKQDDGSWKHARYLIGADADSDVRTFLEGFVERLIEDGFEARLVACKRKAA